MNWNASLRIPTSSLRIVVAGLQALGRPVSAWSSPTVPVAEAVALLEQTLDVGGPACGIEAGRSIPPGALGLVDHLCASAPTGLQMLQDLERYFALVASGVTLHVDTPSLVLALPEAFPVRHRRLLAELVFSLLDERLAQRGQGRALHVAFPWALPEAPGPTTDRWPQVTFGAADCRMTFDVDALRSPLQTANDSLRRLLDSYAAAELATHPTVETLSTRVRKVVRDALPGAPPSAEGAARTLGMSDRSLRRSLREEDTTFSAVRDDTLRAFAQEALGDPERSIGEVAYLLGYSEPSAFHRAFRRWTGTTPEAFRQAGQVGP